MNKYFNIKDLPDEPIHIVISKYNSGKTYHELSKLSDKLDETRHETYKLLMYLYNLIEDKSTDTMEELYKMVAKIYEKTL